MKVLAALVLCLLSSVQSQRIPVKDGSQKLNQGLASFFDNNILPTKQGSGLSGTPFGPSVSPQPAPPPAPLSSGLPDAASCPPCQGRLAGLGLKCCHAEVKLQGDGVQALNGRPGGAGSGRRAESIQRAPIPGLGIQARDQGRPFVQDYIEKQNLRGVRPGAAGTVRANSAGGSPAPQEHPCGDCAGLPVDVCPVEHLFITPDYAVVYDGSTKEIVQVPGLEQHFHLTVCSKDNPDVVYGKCVPTFRYQQILCMDHPRSFNSQPYLEWFELPTGCACEAFIYGPPQ